MSTLHTETVRLSTATLYRELANAPIYRKTALVKAVQIGEKEPPRPVVTILGDGTEETTNTAYPGDWIVTNPGGEQYSIRDSVFTANYIRVEGENLYRAVGRVQAILNYTGHVVVITAPWGEEQRGESGCYIVRQVDKDGKVTGETPYLIAKEVFRNTYERDNS